jgi:hypothetical protein
MIYWNGSGDIDMSSEIEMAIVPELIWRGRLHMGDEPGVYGDASYVGLVTEWPITLKKFEPRSQEAGSAVFHLSAENVSVLPPYKGHRVTFWRYQAAPTPENPLAWSRVQIEPDADHRLSAPEAIIEMDIPDDAPAIYMSVRVEVDTSPQPGLYNELVLVELRLLSTTYFATLGFPFEART